MKKCLVTLLIGDEIRTFWDKHLKSTWVKYAEKHGYDIITIDDYIDNSPMAASRAPHWQKCLILEHPKVKSYESAVWVDADIMINFHTAPCIVEHNASDRIGPGAHPDVPPAIETTHEWRDDSIFHVTIPCAL